jgi:multicomponent Na+:H+ antiporter subunit D
VSTVVAAPLLVALVTAVAALLLRRLPRAQDLVSVAGVFAYAGAVAVLVRRVLDGGAVAYQMGDWPAPYGITLVADGLSAFMLALSAPVAVAALLFSLSDVTRYGRRLSYHALFHFMLVGVTGAFLTGDLFNLFVWFEVMLMASYALVVFHGGAAATSAALRYVVLNLVGSAVMLLAIGGLYATTGTLNMADIARRLADPGAFGVDPAPALGLSALLFAVFALKAGAVPFQFWVPAAYQAAPAPVAAMLAGVLKKVGVYAMVRLYFTVFADAALGVDTLAFFGPVFLAVAAGSVLFGGVGAVDQESMGGLLAYSSIGQVGFILLPLGVGALVPAVRELAVVAALVYALNHAVSKGLLFLVVGSVRNAVGTARFGDLGGLAGAAPVLSGTAFVGLLSLVGVPPLAGFFGKLFVFRTAVDGAAWLALAAALVGALLTIAYVSRAWNRAFWGQATPLVERLAVDRGELAVLLALGVVVAAVGAGFDPVLEFARTAAAAAVDTDAYVDTVLGGATA